MLICRFSVYTYTQCKDSIAIVLLIKILHYNFFIEILNLCSKLTHVYATIKRKVWNRLNNIDNLNKHFTWESYMSCHLVTTSVCVNKLSSPTRRQGVLQLDVNLTPFYFRACQIYYLWYYLLIADFGNDVVQRTPMTLYSVYRCNGCVVLAFPPNWRGWAV